MNKTDWLDMAEYYAKKNSGCNKVSVGSVICNNGVCIFGANRAMPDLCKTPRGCLRVEQFGDDSKAHRGSGDCRAIHSEIDAISSAARKGVSTQGGTIFVTRYPCENCAKAIITAGIKAVFYGGTAEISEYTKDLFDRWDIGCVHVTGWREDLSDR